MSALRFSSRSPALSRARMRRFHVTGVHGPIWITQGVLAAATVGAAWRAGGTTLRNPLALGASIVGAVLFAAFVGFTIAEA